MLNTPIIKKIEEFVSVKPRSVQEISEHIGKNWRTADRYITEIGKEFGTISTRTFREGTRGALKIVFWSSMEKIHSNAFQEILESEIMKGKTKYEFSPFDIFQHIEDKNKEAWINQGEEEEFGIEKLKNLLEQTQKQLLIFSGNLSFINFKDKNIGIFQIIDQLVKKGVNIKIVSRVDLAGKENIEKVLSLNYKYGKELIEIRHREQPLRAIVIDNKIFNIKEIKQPTGREKELNRKTFIFYTIKDKDWTSWISRIFWKMFSSSVDSKKRLGEINKLN